VTTFGIKNPLPGETAEFLFWLSPTQNWQEWKVELTTKWQKGPNETTSSDVKVIAISQPYEKAAIITRDISPSDTVKLHVTAFAEGNASEVMRFLSSDDLAYVASEPESFEELVKEISLDIAESGGIKKFEILEENISDNEATVTIIIYFNDGTEEEEIVLLIKEDGLWKIGY